MKSVQKIRSVLHQPKPIVFAGGNPFKAPGRATLSVMRERARRLKKRAGIGPAPSEATAET